DADEFQRRYAAMPALKKAELLRVVVYVPPPVMLEAHGEPHFELATWVGVYLAATPGVRGGDNTTVRLGPRDQPQPDVVLLLPPDRGRRATIDADGYLSGPPDLAVEVAASSASYDLTVKKELFAEAGVPEYVVWRVRDRRVDWFVLREGRYERREPDPDGIYRSEGFPGLWLDPAALLAGDLAQVLAVLQKGLASPEHAAFRGADS
ncbi:MAG: Uma2 family endonuclease, partial [Armatimonadetes bacterium]|nr:Uma2 family endonuclease [Armatimonadota bacterium]